MLGTAAFICRAMIGWVSAVLEPGQEKVAVSDFGGGVAHRRGAQRHLQRRPPSPHGTSGCSDRCYCCGRTRGKAFAAGSCPRWSLWRSNKPPWRRRHRGGKFPPAGRRCIEGLVPRNLPPLVALEGLRARAGRLRFFADQRRRHPVLVVDEVVAEAAFDTQVAVIDDRVKGRGDFVDVVVLDVELKIAAHAAVGACGRVRCDRPRSWHFLRRFFPPPLVACMISSSENPCLEQRLALGLSAPVGQTPTHWPQNTQVVSGMGLSKKVPIPVSKPRPLKLIA